MWQYSRFARGKTLRLEQLEAVAKSAAFIVLKILPEDISNLIQEVPLGRIQSAASGPFKRSNV